MNGIYLRQPKPRFIFWKWVVFGTLFLLVLNILSSSTDSTPMEALGIILGYLIVLRMSALPRYSSMVWLLSGLGLSILISTLATAILYGYCFLQNSSNICLPNLFRAHIFGNFFFPLAIILVYVGVEIVRAISTTIAYIVRYRRR